MSDIIRQGTDCWIIASNLIDVRTGLQMNVTGYKVTGVARARYQRRVLGRRIYHYRMLDPIVATWNTTPTGTDGVATAGANAIMTSQPIDQVQLHITPTQTETWRCPLVLIQAELIDPVTGYVARIVDEIFEVSFDADND
jgi:hypothetical protein